VVGGDDTPWGARPEGRVTSAITLGRRYLRTAWTPIVLSAVIVVTWAIVEYAGSVTFEEDVMRLFFWLMLVLAWQLFSGNSGVMSFGHVAFVAAGAYFSALLTMSPTLKETTFADMPQFLASWIQPAELGLFESMLAAGALAAVLAGIFGIAVARLAGIAAAIATLAILVIMFTFIVQTPSVTGGSDVLVGVPRETTPGNVAISLIVVIFAVYAFKQSRHGMRLRASRENQEAAQSVAVNLRLERYIAFVIAGLICGVAGALYAHYFSGFAAADFYFELTFIVVAMLVVGGMQSVAGAVVGTYFLTIVYLAARRGEVDGALGIEWPSGTANLLLAIALLLALILRPSGITGGREVPWPGALRRKGPVAASAAGTVPEEVKEAIAAGPSAPEAAPRPDAATRASGESL
jgi:branched-chain amino acid transport system permease protein